MKLISYQSVARTLLITAALLQPVSSLTAAPADMAPQTWTLNFNNTDIQELIHFVADATGKTIIVDPKVTGKVKVVSVDPVGEDELYHLFLSVLDVHGYVAVESGGAIRIVPAKSGRTEALPVVETPGANSEYITHVIQLENISAAKLVPVLRPLVAQQSHLAAYAPSNAIIIADTAANIQRIRQIIDSIDQAAVDKTDVVQLKHASAEDTVRMIELLDKEDAASKGGSQSSRVKLVADARTNSVLINGDEIQRNRIKALVKHLDTPLPTSGNARVIYLEYANAIDVAEVLSKVTANMSKASANNAKGKTVTPTASTAVIEADEATNALIVTANAGDLAMIEGIIEKLDIRRAQVLVEAIIVELSDEDGKDLGVEWMGQSGVGFGSNVSSGLLGSIASGVEAADPTAGLATALAGTRGGTFGIADDDYVAIIRALEEKTNSNILSTPSLLTLDNSEAQIVVGKEVPFTTGSYTNDSGDSSNPFTTIERKDVGITLKVTPQINEGGTVVLQIYQEISSLTGDASKVDASDIITNKRIIETSVLVDNGETVVLGGLIDERLDQVNSQIPLLGDIPWLGRLFRSDANKVVKSNLMIFLKPTIIRDVNSMNIASSKKYRDMREMQLGDKEEGVDLFDDDVMPLLPTWEKQIQRLDEIRAEELEQDPEQQEEQ
ncbi:Secretin ExeD [Sinobacterium norvegicum]|uniref:Secretin ExeD n=1 Tax=Sinobacterium norvegicum TaxID=1641715 RepID=A0ABN8EMS9_9GAMM|nr:type II secretion system secretin GspD [Sinobacterium norvegicum]CAH0992490.1 Secretin ExeD [Sinobacterium norvegicum]